MKTMKKYLSPKTVVILTQTLSLILIPFLLAKPYMQHFNPYFLLYVAYLFITEYLQYLVLISTNRYKTKRTIWIIGLFPVLAIGILQNWLLFILLLCYHTFLAMSLIPSVRMSTSAYCVLLNAFFKGLILNIVGFYLINGFMVQSVILQLIPIFFIVLMAYSAQYIYVTHRNKWWLLFPLLISGIGLLICYRLNIIPLIVMVIGLALYISVLLYHQSRKEINQDFNLLSITQLLIILMILFIK